jgi:predicted CXXCH cytochrome family protein
LLSVGRTTLLICLLQVFTGSVYAQVAKHPCLPCHPKEVERFSNSPMGQSLSAKFDEPAGHFDHPPSGASVTIYRNASGMHHKVQERGVSADYPIAYSIGYGMVGRSYLIDLKGNLFQSPASFYTSKAEWNASPGYEAARLLDFTRAVSPDCLSCHAGSIQKTVETVTLTPLSCDRCHGPAENHLKNPVRGSIVNPAKLPVRERDSVCEQCHLEGATAVLNRGKTWSDFHAGMPLEAVESHYVLRNQEGQLSSMAAVSQAEQLAVSACLRGSGGKLWCGTCHDPHGPKVNRQVEMKQICGSCHPAAQLAAVHSPGQDDCVTCHMPRRNASDITHAAITDHRILKNPAAGAPSPQGRILSAWQPPPPQLSERNLGLAYFHIARQNNSGPNFQRAFDILSKQPQQNDPEVSAAVGYMLLGAGQAESAISCFQAGVDGQPGSAEYWLDLGVAQQTSGNAPGAIRAFSRSIELAPYDYRAYEALSDFYKSAHQPIQASQILQRFLDLVPQSLTVRLLQ